VEEMTRADLLAAIDAEWRALDELVQGIEPKQFELRVLADEAPEPWRVRDLLVHLAAWKRNAIRAGHRREDRDDYPADVLGLDMDEFNRTVLVTWRERPLRDVLDEHSRAHQDLVAMVVEMPLELLTVDGRPRRWLAPALEHTRGHLEGHLRPALSRGG
jgi:hypothetical protein